MNYLYLFLSALLYSDIVSTKGHINFDVNFDQNTELVLNTNGLGIGMTPSANLSVQGNAIIQNGHLSVGGTEANSNLHLHGTMSMSLSIVSSNTILSNDSVVMADTNSAGGNLVLSLPDPQNLQGRVYHLKKLGTNHQVKVLGFIDEDEQITMRSSASFLPYLNVISNGSTWSIIGSSNFLSHQNAVASDNLISYWKLDESTGSMSEDSSTNNNPAIITGTTFNSDSIDGKIQKALNFDGSNDYLDVGDLNSIDFQDTTISFWAKVDSNDRDYDFVTKGTHTTNRPILIWFDDVVGGVADIGAANTNTLSVLSYDGSTMHWVSAQSDALNDTNWHHICVVLKPTTNDLSVYIDGNLSNTNNKSWSGIEATSTSLRFASDSVGNNKLNGAMDDIRIYNKALDASEVAVLYTLGQ